MQLSFSSHYAITGAMQNSLSIFQFEDPVVFLNASFRDKQLKNPKFSLRAWSRQLGYENPSLLFQALRGERRLTMGLAMKLAANMQLKGKSRRYFELMVLNSVCKSDTERQLFTDMLEKLRPKKGPTLTQFTLEKMALVADWYTWTICFLADLPDFEPTVEWIHDRLSGEIDKKTVRNALKRLTEVGLFEKLPNGTFRRAGGVPKSRLVHSDLPSQAIRNYHTQMIEKALASVEQQTRDERILRGSTLSFRKKDLPRVEAIITEAHSKIEKLTAEATGPAEDVYQFNSQFFRLSKKKRERLN